MLHRPGSSSSVCQTTAGLYAEMGVPNNATSAPKLAYLFLVHLFRLGIHWVFTVLLLQHFGTSILLKGFKSWNHHYLLSLLESQAPVSSLTDFRLAWKTATLLALVMVRCPNLTLLCIDNQHFFSLASHCYFIPASDCKMDWLGNLPHEICIQTQPCVNACPVF